MFYTFLSVAFRYGSPRKLIHPSFGFLCLLILQQDLLLLQNWCPSLSPGLWNITPNGTCYRQNCNSSTLPSDYNLALHSLSQVSPTNHSETQLLVLTIPNTYILSHPPSASLCHWDFIPEILYCIAITTSLQRVLTPLSTSSFIILFWEIPAMD